MIIEIISFLLILSLITLLYMHFETRLLKLEVLDHSNGGDYIKIIQLSDIHIGKMYVNYNKIKSIIAQHNPDVLLITGDFFEDKIEIGKFQTFLKSLNLNCKIFMCLGNHDLKLFIKRPDLKNIFIRNMESLGIKILCNESETINFNGYDFNFIGIEDYHWGRPDIEKACKNIESSNGLKIGITHNPELALKTSKVQLDYLFCGHFHGGQIWMPFNVEFYLMRREKLCKSGIFKGLHVINGVKVYINRGLGCVMFPFRFFSKPEITLIKLATK